jgi:hypothetical protein
MIVFFSFSAIFRERVRLVEGAILMASFNWGRAIDGRRTRARVGIRAMPVILFFSSYLTWTIRLVVLAFIGGRGPALRGGVLL